MEKLFGLEMSTIAGVLSAILDPGNRQPGDTGLAPAGVL